MVELPPPGFIVFELRGEEQQRALKLYFMLCHLADPYLQIRRGITLVVAMGVGAALGCFSSLNWTGGVIALVVASGFLLARELVPNARRLRKKLRVLLDREEDWLTFHRIKEACPRLAILPTPLRGLN